MNPKRLVFNDTPAIIPVPVAFQHRKVEVILLPLNEDTEPVEASTSTWTDFFKRYSRQVDDATLVRVMNCISNNQILKEFPNERIPSSLRRCPGIYSYS